MMRLLAAGIGLGALSRVGAQTVQAANGDPVLAGQSIDATAPTRVRNGVSYTPDSTADGVQGYATGANNAGLFGRNNVTDGIGVAGAAPSGTGVFGESVNGFGVGGRATSGVGVRGESASGLGAAFAGGLAAIRLVPAATGTGAPATGAHQVGELYADSTGALYYCTTAGTPGTWLPVVLGSGGGGLTNPMTAQDDLIVGGTSGAPTRLAKGSNGQVLTLNGSGHVAWATPSGGGGGSTWRRTLVDPPPLSTWSWVNQGAATAVDDPDGHGVMMTAPAVGATNLRILKRSLPSTPWTVTAALVPLMYQVNQNSLGLVLRESSSGKLIYLQIYQSAGSGAVSSNTYSSPATYSGGYSGHPVIPPTIGSVAWLRFSDDGTTRGYHYSLDGKTWVLLHSHANTTWITANEIGFAVDASNGSFGPSVKLVSWEVS